LSEGAVTYRFLSVIGEGGFGRVYRARMETSDGFHKDVAIKVLTDPDPPRQLLQRFRDEAKILGLVRDRAFVTVEPPIVLGGRWAVVMEFIDGVSAGAMIHGGRVPPGVAVEIVGEVARALHHAFHMDGPEGEQLQLLHRDIKPDNIQLTPAGEVRVLDFGIARANFAAREFKTRHSLGGTPGYIAPERVQGIELPAGDVFSLGVVLHELVSGTRPRFAATVHLDTESDLAEIAAEMDVDPELLADPHAGPVLRLAAQMRAAEPEARPTARQVEESCRSLRQKLPAPYYRDWAEEKIPHRMELEKDELISQVLTATHGTLTIPSSVPAPPRLDRPSGPPETQLQNPLTNPGTGSNLALGALVGGGAALVLGGGGTLLLLVGMLGLWLWYSETDPVVKGPQLPVSDPTPVMPVEPDPAEPEPVEPGPAQPAPVVPVIPVEPDPVQPGQPQPQPVRPGPDTVVIALPDPEPAPRPNPGQVEPAPVNPVPVEPAAPTLPTGLVIVKTVPSGATVSEGGQKLEQSGRGYVLPVGRHRLEIKSPGGETYPITVMLKRGETVEICYSFDTNSACGAAVP
jgi:serine/threonine protein kinase